MNWRETPSDAELLKQETERRHILAAIAEALDHHVEVHEILFGAEDVDAARAALVARYGWREIDANAVMDMQQRRLPRSEREKVVYQLRIADQRIEELTERIEEDTH